MQIPISIDLMEAGGMLDFAIDSIFCALLPI